MGTNACLEVGLQPQKVEHINENKVCFQGDNVPI